MTDPTDDEAWVAALRARAADVTPPVPVDVPRALRKGRRRRAVRGAAVGAGALVVAFGVVVGGASLLPNLQGGSSDSSASMVESAADQDAGSDAAGGAAGAPVPGSSGEAADSSRPTMTPPELVAAVADGTVPSEGVLVEQDAVPADDFLKSIGTTQADDPVVTPPGDWSSLMAACLGRAKWPAEIVLGSGGWEIELTPDEAEAFVPDLRYCAARYQLS